MEPNFYSGENLSERQKKFIQEVLKVSQDFFQKESSGLSLITVTNANVSRALDHTTIFISVLPESKEQAALDFAKRMRSDLRQEIKKRIPVKIIPHVEVELDYGEKNRQHIDALSRETKLSEAKNTETSHVAESETESASDKQK